MPQPSPLSTLVHSSSVNRHRSRIVLLLIAGVVCAMSSLFIGFGAWHLLGNHENQANLSSTVPHVVETPAAAAAVVVVMPAPLPVEIPQAPQATVLPIHYSESPFPQTLAVEAGVVELFGEQKGDQPALKVIVGPFLISETEVTNNQFRDFVKATNHRPPAHWENGESPSGEGDKPVTSVTWQDAVDYCLWLSEKTGTEARLPTEAEWMHAATGPGKLKYPWGNQWDERAATRDAKERLPGVVKSYPLNKSFFGAYDMAGNVWEWVSDGEANKTDTPAKDLKIIKGGAVDESPEMLSSTSRSLVPADSADSLLGFRYVVAVQPKAPAGQLR